MKYLIFTGIVLSTIGKTKALVDPFLSTRSLIFADGIKKCKEANGMFYFDSYEKFICLSSPNGIIDFSDSTEIVGTNFAKRNVIDRSSDNLKYSWELCDKNSEIYNHKKCMKEASYLSAVESMDKDIIYQKAECENESFSEYNTFYYRRYGEGRKDFDYACIERFNSSKFFIEANMLSDLDKYSIPSDCMLKDGQFNCDFYCEVNGNLLTSHNYYYYGSNKKDVLAEQVNCLGAVETMTEARKVSSAPYTSSRTYAYTTTVKSPTTVSLYGNGSYPTTLPIEVPEDVSKMFMLCKYYSDPVPKELCFSNSDNSIAEKDCYQLHKRVNDDKKCDVYTFKKEPYVKTITTYKEFSDVKTFTQVSTTNCKTINENKKTCITYKSNTYTMQPFTETIAIRKNVETPVPTAFWSEKLGYPRCDNCEVIYSDEDGEWGFENNNWCGIDSENCSNEIPTEFWSEKLGYPRCDNCEVIYTDGDGKWGYENNNWCGIDSENCSNEIPTEFWSEKLGYPRCDNCEVIYTDGDGKWGYENNNWCGIDIEKCSTKSTTTTTTTLVVSPTVFWSEMIGYPRCNHCNVVYSDEMGKWGYENGEWCGIDNKECIDGGNED